MILLDKRQYVSSNTIMRTKISVNRGSIITDKRKDQVHLIQALRLCTGRTAHTGSRGIALLYRH